VDEFVIIIAKQARFLTLAKLPCNYSTYPVFIRKLRMAQANPLIDAENGKKGRFQKKTI